MKKNNSTIPLLRTCTLFLLPLILLSTPTTFDDLKTQVTLIGKLPFKTNTPIHYATKSQMKNFLNDLVDRQYPGDLAAKDALYLQLMGFTRESLDLKKIHKKIVQNSVGTAYDKKTKELIVKESYRTIDIINSVAIVHELRHAVQDQHFDLSFLLDRYSYFDDRQLAVAAAVEGDATLIMLHFHGSLPELMTGTYASDSLLSLCPIGNISQLYRAPNIIRQRITMPYIHGLNFTNAILNKKKWKGVIAILEKPPTSSSQILHPEKFLKRETPTPVTITYQPEGYQPYHSGVIGEFYLNVLLMSGDNYIDYASGWQGDTFSIFRNATDSFLTWKSTWDSPQSCNNYFQEFKRFIEKEYQVTFKEGSIKESPFIAGQSNTGDGFFFIKITDKTMIYTRTTDKNQMNKYIFGGIYD